MRTIAGIGVGLRHEFVDEIATTDRAVDFLEIVPENWLNPHRRARLAPCLERWAAIPHSIHLSIGGPDPVDREFLAAMRAMTREVDAPFYSDHVCYSTIGGIQTNELLPLPFSDEALAHTIGRIAEVRRDLDVPLVLENPTYYSVMPGSHLDEATFLATLMQEADLGMLLDVNNVYVNATNHGYDPYAFIDRMPLDRVRYLHVAGHFDNKRLATIIDTHGAPVIDPVWALYEHTLRRAGAMIPTVLEWDSHIPALAEVLDQLDLARAHAATALAAPAAAAG